MSESKQRSQRYGEWVIRWRWPLLALSILVALAAGSGGQRLAFDNDYRAFFSDENPQLQAFEQLQKTYTKIDNILFMVAPNEGVLTPEVIAGVEELVAESWKLPYVLRVDAITNYQHTIATEDDLLVQDLIEGAGAMSQADLEAALEIAGTEPMLDGYLISRDKKFTGVNATFQLPGKELTEVPEVVAAARELEARIEAEYPVDLVLTGMVLLNNAFFSASIRDMSTLVPAMYVLIILVALLLLRSFTAVLGTVIVIALSVMTAMGIAGWIGIGLTPPSTAAPTIIMTLAVADSIHILMTLLGDMRMNGTEKRAAIVESLRQNLQPVILTSLTTAVGFLSLTFSDSPPFAHLGLITAIGVIFALFYSVTFLPAFLAVVPLRPKRSLSEMGILMERHSELVIRNSNRFLVGTLIVAAALVAFIPTIELNDDFVGYFAKGTQFRDDVDRTTESMAGVYQLQVSLDSGESNGISNPEFLAKVQAYTEWLRTQPEVRQVDSISDTFLRLNKNLHGDDPAYYKLPETREEGAQYLLLYELSLPYGLDLNNRLNVDKSTTQVMATLDNMSSRDLREIGHRAQTWLRDEVGLEATAIGPSIMFAHISDRNIKNMLLGTFIAVVIISIIMIVALRSVRIGLISLIPNILPAAMAFGLWAILKGEVNMAVSMVSGMALGIVVDDSVHFLSKYLRARREKHLDPEDAIRYAFTHVGRALVVTTIILVAGFGILAQSKFAMNSYMATLTAIAILFALFADFFLLPALLMKLDSRDDWKKQAAPEAAAAALTTS